jgi:hypothetical protein
MARGTGIRDSRLPSAVDALGHAQSIELHEGRLTAQVTLTPALHHRRLIPGCPGLKALVD